MIKKILSILLATGLFLFFASPVKAEYRVGVDYHATGENLLTTTFIKQYNNPVVRNLVKQQLQGMADSGARVINTVIWMVDPTQNGQYIEIGQHLTDYYRQGFPLTTQELQNIHDYAQDVANIKTPDGKYLDLTFGLAYQRCGWPGMYTAESDPYHTYSDQNFVNSCPQTFLPWVADPNRAWNTYVSLARQSIDSFFGAIADVTHDNGTKAVSQVTYDGELTILHNIPTFDHLWGWREERVTQIYPYFIQKARSYGIEPSIEFIIYPNEESIMNNNYQNAAYPAINGHGSLSWIYPTIKFMQDNGVEIPKRLDISFYPKPRTDGQTSAGYAAIISRVMTDLKTIFPGKDIAITETFYPQDQAQRKAYGQDFVKAYKTLGEPVETKIWSTPNSGFNAGENAAYPFDFAAYYVTIPGDLNFDGKVDIYDYNLLVSNFGKTGSNLVGDIDNNGKVDIFDYNVLVGNFGK